MTRTSSLHSKVFGRFHQPRAQQHLPPAIHGHASRQRVGRDRSASRARSSRVASGVDASPDQTTRAARDRPRRRALVVLTAHRAGGSDGVPSISLHDHRHRDRSSRRASSRPGICLQLVHESFGATDVSMRSTHKIAAVVAVVVHCVAPDPEQRRGSRRAFPVPRPCASPCDFSRCDQSHAEHLHIRRSGRETGPTRGGCPM